MSLSDRGLTNDNDRRAYYPGTSGAGAAADAFVLLFMVFRPLVVAVVVNCLVARSRLVPKPQQPPTRRRRRSRFCCSVLILADVAFYSFWF